MRLEIFAITGSRAAILIGRGNDAGIYNFDVGGLNLTPGMYAYTLTAPNVKH